NIATVIYKIINEEPIPPRSLDSSIHPGLSAVITRALAKEPAARYQSCHEFLNALKKFHEMIGPEPTVRRLPTSSQPAQGTNRPVALPTRAATVPMVPASFEADPTAQFMLPVAVEEKSSKRPGGLLLTLILLGIIGYSGYRVYPPLVDLWQRAREPVEAPVNPAKAESAPQPSNPENSNPKPEAQSEDTPQTIAPAPNTLAAPVEKSAQRGAPQPMAAPGTDTSVKPSEPALAPTISPAISVEKPIAPQKPAPPAGPSPAHLLETILRSELAGTSLADK